MPVRVDQHGRIDFSDASSELFAARHRMREHEIANPGCSCHSGPDLCPEGAKLWQAYKAIYDAEVVRS